MPNPNHGPDGKFTSGSAGGRGGGGGGRRIAHNQRVRSEIRRSGRNPLPVSAAMGARGVVIDHGITRHGDLTALKNKTDRSLRKYKTPPKPINLKAAAAVLAKEGSGKQAALARADKQVRKLKAESRKHGRGGMESKVPIATKIGKIYDRQRIIQHGVPKRNRGKAARRLTRRR